MYKHEIRQYFMHTYYMTSSSLKVSQTQILLANIESSNTKNKNVNFYIIILLTWALSVPA